MIAGYEEDSWCPISVLKLLKTLIDINPHFKNICSTTADGLLHYLVIPLILLVANVYGMLAICIQFAWLTRLHQYKVLFMIAFVNNRRNNKIKD